MQDFTPTYYQIKEDIKRKITQGELHPGQLLPGRKPLSEQYGCGWSTLNRAVNELILEGLLVAERGKGTFVSNHVNQQDDLQKVKVWFCHPFPSVYSMLFEMMEGMREEAHRKGNSIQFLNTVNANEPMQNLDEYIVVTPSNDQFDDLCQAWERGERFVVLNSSFDHAPFPTIDADIYHATEKAIEYLIDKGHEKIGNLGIRYGFSNYERRLAAYMDTYMNRGSSVDENWLVGRPENLLEARKLYESWIDDHQECTAVFACDYTTAMIVLDTVQGLGMKIPEELSIFGVGDPPFASTLKVSLSTIVQPFYEMGKIAVNRVLQENWSIEPVMVPCELKIRDSVSDHQL